jgi:hypothetical protein
MGLKAVIVVGATTSQTFTSGPITVAPASGITIVGINASAPTTVNLPATPALNQIVIVQDQGNNSATNNITVQGNGHNILQPQVGLETNVVIGANGTDAWFNWNGTQWGILA